MIDFNRWLKVQAGRYNDKPAIIFDKRQISYRELNQLTAALANRWLKQGFKPGDRIGLAFKNAPEIILINYAAWRAGLVTVPLDTTRDTPALKKYKLKFTGAKICFDPANFKLPSTQTSVSLPVRGGAPTLGTWQGIYLYEHRRRSHHRVVVAHLLGE